MKCWRGEESGKRGCCEDHLKWNDLDYPLDEHLPDEGPPKLGGDGRDGEVDAVRKARIHPRTARPDEVEPRQAHESIKLPAHKTQLVDNPASK